MEKSRPSPLSFLFPWLAPHVLTFALVDNGIEIQLWRNNRLLSDWHSSQLKRILPESLIQWIADNHLHEGPQPYPLIKQFWQSLLPIASKKLIIDASVLAELEEGSQPQDFALIWAINHSSLHIEGRYDGADGYLGMGWFYKGTKIWRLNNQPSNAVDLQLKQLILPLEQVDFLLNSTVPHLQQYLPIHVDFQFITDFAVQVLVPDAHMGRLTLTIQCNYPQLLPIIHVPQQKSDMLVAQQALIRLPYQALTPVMRRLLQSGGSPLTIQGADIPLFIVEQVAIMRHFAQLSEEMTTKITQSNPIVSIVTLLPAFRVTHRRESGLGFYAITATYQYQQQPLDMNTLLAAYRKNQRFVQQQGTWFEWPYKAHDLANTIQQHLTEQRLRSEEIMGFDTRRMAHLSHQLPFHTIQPAGTMPAQRAQSIFEQLQYHGIPGGIIGEPKGLIAIFASVCGKLLHINPSARILWLIPSSKKGSVTRAINNSSISSFVMVASLVTLRDEPALISPAWTLVIFQELDALLDGSVQSHALPQLQWRWALLSMTSKQARTPLSMRVLHMPEQYYKQFHTHYLFDLEKNYDGTTTDQRASSYNPIQFVPPVLPENKAYNPSIDLSQAPRITMHFNQQIKRKPEQPPIPLTTSTQEKSLGNDAKPGQQKLGNILAVEKRVTLLQQYWKLFDKIHAHQEAGMKPLWGLVEDSRIFDFEHRFISNESYQFQLYEQLLPSTLLAKIEELWGTCMFPRWPEYIISEPFPHKLFAETFGVALQFWHGCALTAWFICEGPSSRTDLANLAEYYHKDVQALKEMGTPINERIFEDLASAEAQLGEPQLFTRPATTSYGQFGITTNSMRISGTRRKGFGKLRDIISFYRRQWAERYLDQYLQIRWETEIREVAHAYNLSIDQKGVPSTAKQLAKNAHTATNHWFGGNISELYRAIHEQSSLQPQRRAILPVARVAFAFAVFNKLSRPEHHFSQQEGSQIERRGNSHYYQVNKLAAFSFWYMQLEEALGQPPTLQEFGANKFGQASEVLHEDINLAWKIFSRAIDAAKQAFSISNVQNQLLANGSIASARPEIAREYAKDEFEKDVVIPSPTIRPIVRLNQEKISKLHEESEQVQERLTVEDEIREQLSGSIPVPPIAVVRETIKIAPNIDEDWQIIQQQWRPEHWEILKLLCLEQSVQLTTEERKNRRPVSQLIDEINFPVDEHLGDLLIDPDTQTLSPHLRVLADSLVNWYYASKDR